MRIFTGNPSSFDFAFLFCNIDKPISESRYKTWINTAKKQISIITRDDQVIQFCKELGMVEGVLT